jgi:inactivated superfamily I helicase
MHDARPHQIFALPPGADFPAELVAGLKERMAGKPSESMGRVTLYLNTSRMRRRVEEAFRETGPGFLPKLRLVSDLARDPRLALPTATSPLRRRLELTTLIAALLDRQPDIAPRAALYDLADSLAKLMDEMQGEGVSAYAGFLADSDADFSQLWRPRSAATACCNATVDALGHGATKRSDPDRRFNGIPGNHCHVYADCRATASGCTGSARFRF